MEILFYRYNSICEPDVIMAFQKFGITVTEERTQMTRKNITPAETVDTVGRLLTERKFLFVFSINFFPAISEVCEIAQIPYVCWTVDVPVMELFSSAIKNKCNRIFLFDRTQYRYFYEKNPEGIFYLPLATNVQRWDAVLKAAKGTECSAYASDISFVGSLYNEKNAYHRINGLSEYAKGYIQGLIEAQLQVYGVNFIESMLTDRIMKEMDLLVPELHLVPCDGNPDAQRYLIANEHIGSELAETERKRLLNALSEIFTVDLYTHSDTSGLRGVRAHKGIDTHTQMPLVFYNSKINLNITMRPIATGLSLRIYDVCGCGGFLLTNWQEELPELYEPGAEVEIFGSKEEMLDKAGYYLEHEEERAAIALRGYERTVAEHTYDRRIAEMIRVLNGTI
ncbi:MAG: glycosyltransferase [Lachnospiraceae bacterium]|nr:glycosyltransferase [Lachnospiraceae bacterium]